MTSIVDDFPSQFQDMPHIEWLADAVCIELDALRQMFADLPKLLDLDAAHDKILDGLGDIVVLSRAQAGLLAKNGITFPVIEDERYRRFIRYKILKNTSICNIEDILNAITMLWGITPTHYDEPPDEPATMSITFADPGGGPDAYDDIPPIKAAGVGIHIKATSERHSKGQLYAGALAGVHEDVRIETASKVARVRRPLYAGCAVFLDEQMHVGAIARKAGKKEG